MEAAVLMNRRRCKPGLCRVGLNRYLIASMERETGIEPATSSLGSCCLDSAQRKIKHLERVM